ncbi:MAG: 4-alpha-glucanotransferase [Erysipelotrichaceae bacterium]|nr:4-alpha-glucanotransferase [Erysipelotrichaceae bacterium]
MRKDAGLLFPISCLPNAYGIGDFGKNAYELVDKMADAHIHVWQILPLNPLGYGNSPYQPLSSQAGDEIYLSLDQFVDEGLLDHIDSYNEDATAVAYQEIRKIKFALYQKAFENFRPDDSYYQFLEDNSWVKDYAIYKVFKTINNELPWTEWKKEYKNYVNDKSFSLTSLTKEIELYIFLQYEFFKQWDGLKKYANEHDIIIIGDMPIYVGLDSVDVWTNQERFLLEEDGTPSFVAGVPPDYFSAYGQRWGNPIYDWDYLKENGFKFWVDRLKAALNMYDTVRIDHFRAFDTYWKIPASEPTAIIGEWVEAPGYALFDTLIDELDNFSVLAEDLGDLRAEVYDLRDHYHLKGMYIFQFHHSDDFDMNKVVVYTGTHDNDTIVAWYDELDDHYKKKIQHVLKDYDEAEIHQKILHYCLDLEAETIIIPVWDIMGCGKGCRFNVPSTIGSPNWEWRISSFVEFDKALAVYKDLIHQSLRDSSYPHYTYSDYVYEIVDDKIQLLKYCGHREELVVPKKIHDHTITIIGNGCFEDNMFIKNVKLPSTVEVIEENAFKNCHTLESIDLSSCSLTHILKDTFGHCTNLTSLLLPKSLISIDNALGYCESLRTLTIPAHVISLNIENVSDDFEIYIYQGSKGEQLANKNCIRFSYIDEPVFEFEILDNEYAEIKVYHGHKKMIEIPTYYQSYKVISVGEKLFYHNDDIKIIYISDTITTIKSQAFKNCPELLVVQIPESVMNIADDVFDERVYIETKKDSYAYQYALNHHLKIIE